jgi:hypothetical protein
LKARRSKTPVKTGGNLGLVGRRELYLDYKQLINIGLMGL